jgi:hypothetical protein
MQRRDIPGAGLVHKPVDRERPGRNLGRPYCRHCAGVADEQPRYQGDVVVEQMRWCLNVELGSIQHHESGLGRRRQRSIVELPQRICHVLKLAQPRQRSGPDLSRLRAVASAEIL